MPRRDLITRSGKFYRKNLENFIYNPLKPRSDSEGELEISSSSEFEEEGSSNHKPLSLFPTPSTPLLRLYHKTPTPPRSPYPPPPPPPPGANMVVSMKLPNFRGIGNGDTEHFCFVTEAIWKA